MLNTKTIFRFLTILWMIIIFSFSARTGTVSTGDSHNVGIFIGSTFIPGFDSWNEQRQISFAKKIDHPVRKTAHASEYAVLGFLGAGASVFIKKYKKDKNIENRTVADTGIKYIYIFMSSRYRTSWLLGTFYAASDEFHQLFVPGRSGQVTDVLIDSAGVLVGVVVFYCLSAVWKRHVRM